MITQFRITRADLMAADTPAPAKPAHTPFPNLEARNTPANVPELPWFIIHDEALDCEPHANSGLAKIDTGRESDWTVARLLEWPTAEFIVKACSTYAETATERDRLKAQVQALLASCEYVAGFSYTDYAAKYGEQSALQELVAIKRHVRRAIASVESEQVKD